MLHRTDGRHIDGNRTDWIRGQHRINRTHGTDGRRVDGAGTNRPNRAEGCDRRNGRRVDGAGTSRPNRADGRDGSRGHFSEYRCNRSNGTDGRHGRDGRNGPDGFGDEHWRNRTDGTHRTYRIWIDGTDRC
jgi:hypothetical protein